MTRQPRPCSRVTVAVGSQGVRFLRCFSEHVHFEAPYPLIVKPGRNLSSRSGSAHQMRNGRSAPGWIEDSGLRGGNKLALVARPRFDMSRRNFKEAKETLYRSLYGVPHQ